MTTLTVNINNKKTEKAIKAVLDALGLDYSVAEKSAEEQLSKSEQEIFDRLKRSAEQIKKHQNGEVKLRSIDEVLNEVS